MEEEDIETVKLLLSDERVYSKDYINLALNWACRNGHDESIKLILSDKRSNPSNDDNRGIRWAIIFILLRS